MDFARSQPQGHSNPNEPVHLLNLPLNIRHQIYKFFTAEALQVARGELEEHCFDKTLMVKISKEDFGNLRTAPSSLLLVNKQVRSEFLNFCCKGSELWANVLSLLRWPVPIHSLQEIVLCKYLNFVPISRAIFLRTIVHDWETALWDLASRKPLQCDAVRQRFHSRSLCHRLLKDWQAVREVEVATDGAFWTRRSALLHLSGNPSVS